MAGGYSQSLSTGASSSTSSPVSVNSPQSDFALQLAGFAEQLASSQASWAAGVWASTSAISDAAINQLTQQETQAANAASSNINQYINTFAPINNALVQAANTYASSGFQAQQEGAAESTQAQAANAARIAAETNLQSYGIDPSSGRYQDIEAAQRTAGAAAAAGAGTQTGLAVKQQGLNLQTQAADVGLQTEAQGINAMNSAIGAANSAANAGTTLANTGVNLTTSPNAFLNTAMQLKYPPVGQNSSSQSAQRDISSSRPSNQPSNSGNTGNTGNTSRGGGGYQPNNGDYGRFGGRTPTSNNSNGGNYQVKGMNTRGVPGIQSVSGGNNGSGYGNYSNPAADQFNSSAINTLANQPGGYTPSSTDQSVGSQYFDPYSAGPIQDNSMGVNSFGGNTNAGGTDFGGPTPASNAGANYGSSGNLNYDFNNANPTDPWAGGQTYGNTSGNPGGYTPQQQSSGGYTPQQQSSGGYTPQSSSGGGGYYARGGRVPPQSSPSGGQQPDDVHANLTAGEFVMPKDVAAWKGQEHFQKMIKQSRQAMAEAAATGAHGKAGPPARGPVRFHSHPPQQQGFGNG